MKKTVLAICGSTRAQSSNLFIIQHVAALMANDAEFDLYDGLTQLPYFNPDLDKETAPPSVEAFRQKISTVDGVLICTPEYVFSLPGIVKNAIEWCVSATIFSGKPVALITASASGAAAHQSLQTIMKTIYADLRSETQLLVQGAKGKIERDGNLTDSTTAEQLKTLAQAFLRQMTIDSSNQPNPHST
ncbi:MAG: NADPH-dependent FMN reductase [Flavisolibacter sp.]